MTYTLSKVSLGNLEHVNPRLVDVVKHAIEITTQDFRVTDGARTADEQHALFLKGYSQKDGFKHKSNHQITSDGTGHAVDLVPWVNGKPEWDWKRIYPIAVAMSKASQDLHTPLRWGGNWYRQLKGGSVEDMIALVESYKRAHPGSDFIDGPHFEILPG